METTTCNTCCRPSNAPYRRHDIRGNVVEGCVDAVHTGQLIPLTESYRWHNRPEAKAIRATNAKHLKNLGK